MRALQQMRAVRMGAWALSLAAGRGGAVSPPGGHTVVLLCPLSTVRFPGWIAPLGAKEASLRLCEFFPLPYLISVKYI